jgi:hypothetical protein
MRHGGEHSGNSYDRAARKRFLLSPEAGFGGDSRTVECNWCGDPLTLETITVDRFPDCGHNGGTYRRNNIVPACQPCNSEACSCARRRTA